VIKKNGMAGELILVVVRSVEERRGACRLVVGKPEEKRPRGINRRK